MDATNNAEFLAALNGGKGDLEEWLSFNNESNGGRRLDFMPQPPNRSLSL